MVDCGGRPALRRVASGRGCGGAFEGSCGLRPTVGRFAQDPPGLVRRAWGRVGCVPWWDALRRTLPGRSAAGGVVWVASRGGTLCAGPCRVGPPRVGSCGLRPVVGRFAQDPPGVGPPRVGSGGLRPVVGRFAQDPPGVGPPRVGLCGLHPTVGRFARDVCTASVPTMASHCLAEESRAPNRSRGRAAVVDLACRLRRSGGRPPALARTAARDRPRPASTAAPPGRR